MATLADINWFAPQHVLGVMLVGTRLTGLMALSPPFNSAQGVPMLIKAGIALTIALMLYGVQPNPAPMGGGLPGFLLAAAQELLIGLAMGFCVRLVFAAVQGAGEFIAVQSGLGMASTISPDSPMPTPVVAELFSMFATLLFLSLNVHHLLLVGMAKSFTWLPVGGFFADGGRIAADFTLWASDVLMMALLLALPILGVLLVTEISLGFVAKVMPQMNVFIVGMPLKLGLGFGAMLITLPQIASFLGDHYSVLLSQIFGLFKG